MIVVGVLIFVITLIIAMERMRFGITLIVSLLLSILIGAYDIFSPTIEKISYSIRVIDSEVEGVDDYDCGIWKYKIYNYPPIFPGAVISSPTKVVKIKKLMSCVDLKLELNPIQVSDENEDIHMK